MCSPERACFTKSWYYRRSKGQEMTSDHRTQIFVLAMLLQIARLTNYASDIIEEEVAKW